MSGDDLPAHATIDDWIREEAVPFSPGSPPSLEDAVDRLAATARGAAVLGLGEALHGGSGTLELRNRLFARLVVAHGFTAIALESSYPRGRLVDDFVAGRVPGPYGALADDGFSHGFGRLEKNRELVEWMRSYNASRPRSAQLRFYGFDAPTEMTHTESPRALIAFVLDLLDAGAGRRARVDALLGDDAAWAEPAAMMDPSRSIGGSAAASALRLELGEIEAELLVRRPELVAAAGRDRYLEAVHHATLARRLLVYHAWVATPGGAGRVARLLGLRDGMMAGTLAHAAALEAARGGRLLAFGHASHLRRGTAVWRLGGMDLSWWTAGAHLDAVLGDAYAVIGAAIGVSAPNGIGPPGPGTLEARLVAAPGPGRFVPTHRGRGLPEGDLAAAAARPRDARNSSYFPLDPLNLADYDWLVALDEEGYDPGGPPLPG